MKPTLNYKLFDKCLTWNTEDDAVINVSQFNCISCNAVITFSIKKDGHGATPAQLTNELAAHIAKLEESYHATCYEVIKNCPNGHTNSLLIIFGETQPTRYILTQAGIATR